MDLGLKNALFDECLISDGWLVLLSGLFVVVCMIFYTSSVFITAMTLVAIVFSLGVSYFIYKFIFKLTFFPFMNILAVIVIIGESSQVNYNHSVPIAIYVNRSRLIFPILLQESAPMTRSFSSSCGSARSRKRPNRMDSQRTPRTVPQ